MTQAPVQALLPALPPCPLETALQALTDHQTQVQTRAQTLAPSPLRLLTLGVFSLAIGEVILLTLMLV